MSTNEVSIENCSFTKTNFRPDIHCPQCNNLNSIRLFGHATKDERPTHKCLDCGKHFGHNCPY